MMAVGIPAVDRRREKLSVGELFSRCAPSLDYPSLRATRLAQTLGMDAAIYSEGHCTCVATLDPGCRPGLCGSTKISKTITAKITPDARERLRSRPPALIGLSRKSPTVAPSGRVNMKAAQNSNTRETVVR